MCAYGVGLLDAMTATLIHSQIAVKWHERDARLRREL
jgi:hypothetical protein